MTINKYQKLLDIVNDNTAILTAGKIHDDIPTIHDVGHSLITDHEVIHCGFGLFRSKVLGKDIYFDGGGAMLTLYDNNDDYIVSYTRLSADHDQLVSMGYNLERVKLALESFNE